VQLRETIGYRTIKAPIDGKVFDTKVSRYSVVNPDQTVLKLVPSNRLQAKVEISNSDIGFVKVGMPATVAVDSFPSGEFGYIKGTLNSLGSDALEPSPQSPQYRFPATITLQEQIVEAGDKRLNLQSGMAVTANIKLRSRPVISIVSDLFTKQLDGVKRFR
jgi:HlyD family secretion protein